MHFTGWDHGQDEYYHHIIIVYSTPAIEESYGLESYPTDQDVEIDNVVMLEIFKSIQFN